MPATMSRLDISAAEKTKDISQKISTIEEVEEVEKNCSIVEDEDVAENQECEDLEEIVSIHR